MTVKTSKKVALSADGLLSRKWREIRKIIDRKIQQEKRPAEGKPQVEMLLENRADVFGYPSNVIIGRISPFVEDLSSFLTVSSINVEPDSPIQNSQIKVVLEHDPPMDHLLLSLKGRNINAGKPFSPQHFYGVARRTIASNDVFPSNLNEFESFASESLYHVAEKEIVQSEFLRLRSAMAKFISMIS